MKCGICKIDYPDEILSRMYINGAYTAPICGICALEKTNEIHGSTRTAFSGSIAEGNRLAALAHRGKRG